MAHLLSISDIKLERERLINSISILEHSPFFSQMEKDVLEEIYKRQLNIYDSAIARNVDVKEFELHSGDGLCFKTFWERNVDSKPITVLDTLLQDKKIVTISEIMYKYIDFNILLLVGSEFSGKKTYATTISKSFKSPLFLGGKTGLEVQSKFLFNDANDSTDLIVFYDIDINSIENLVFRFSDDYLNIHKRSKEAFNIKTPKLIITADSNNCNIEQLSQSVKRRLLIVKV